MDDFKNNLPESDHAGFAPPQNDATPTSTPANDAAAASAANPFQQPAPRTTTALTTEMTAIFQPFIFFLDFAPTI